MLMRRDSGFPHFDQGISLDALVDDTLVQMTVALAVPYNHQRSPLFTDLIQPPKV
jgi:hypothetical protein